MPTVDDLDKSSTTPAGRALQRESKVQGCIALAAILAAVVWIASMCAR